MPRSLSPIAETLVRAEAAAPWMRYLIGAPNEPGWSRCDGVDEAFLEGWQHDVIDSYQELYGSCPLQTAVAHVLIYYADIPATIGALCFRIDKRVPCLGRRDLQFHRRSGYFGVDGVALGSTRFWCLPDDPAANHLDAVVTDDLEALARRLRSSLRRHADEFLPLLPHRELLAERHWLGAFFDALDAGFSLGIDNHDASSAIALASRVLPGETDEFRDSSRLSPAPVDSVFALRQRRVSCCYFDKAAGAEKKCPSCPRLAH